jgi:hypothetical protein
MGGSEIESVPSDLEKGPPQREKYNQQHAKPRNFCPSIYHDQIVKPKLQHRPWLESLHQFMDPSANGFAMDLASNCRMDHFDIKVIHFPKSGKPYLIIKCLTSEDFEAAINDDEERGGTLVIGKGISRAMIETLGVRFELEPEFFAQYLEGTELFRMGTQISGAPANAPNFLPEYVRRAPFYTAEYRRPYHIEGGQQMVIHLRSTETTTPRGVQIIHRDLPDVFYAEKISVYKRKGSNIGKPEITKNHQNTVTMKKSDILRTQLSSLPINFFPLPRPLPTFYVQSVYLVGMRMLRAPLTAGGIKCQLDGS